MTYTDHQGHAQNMVGISHGRMVEQIPQYILATDKKSSSETLLKRLKRLHESVPGVRLRQMNTQSYLHYLKIQFELGSVYSVLSLPHPWAGKFFQEKVVNTEKATKPISSPEMKNKR